MLAVAPGPREAEALAADLEAFLGADRVALLPAWEALPYEGISPAPEVAARRAAAVAARVRPRARSCSWPRCSRRCRASSRPSASTPRCSSSPASSCRLTTLAERLVELGLCAVRRRRAPWRVRRAGRRGRRLPGAAGGAPCASTTGATRSSRSGSSCRRPSSRPIGWRSPMLPATRELIPDDAAARPCGDRRCRRAGALRRPAPAARRRPVRRRSRDARSVPVRPHADPGRAAARGRLGGR